MLKARKDKSRQGMQLTELAYKSLSFLFFHSLVSRTHTHTHTDACSPCALVRFQTTTTATTVVHAWCSDGEQRTSANEWVFLLNEKKKKMESCCLHFLRRFVFFLDGTKEMGWIEQCSADASFSYLTSFNMAVSPACGMDRAHDG